MLTVNTHTHTQTHRKSIIGKRVACRAAPRSTRKPNPPFLIKPMLYAGNLHTEKQQQKLRCNSFFHYAASSIKVLSQKSEADHLPFGDSFPSANQLHRTDLKSETSLIHLEKLQRQGVLQFFRRRRRRKKRK